MADTKDAWNGIKVGETVSYEGKKLGVVKVRHTNGKGQKMLSVLCPKPAKLNGRTVSHVSIPASAATIAS